MSLTVACVWVNGHVDYGVEYVHKLHAMCKRHIPGEFTFYCLTDKPRDVFRSGIYEHHWVGVTPKPTAPIMREDIWATPIAPHAGLFGWWSKIELFNPRHGFTGRMLYLDLDTLIVGDLTPVIEYPAEFALVPHAGTFNGKHGLSVVKRFNSSVMVWNAGTQDHVYNNWTPAVAQRLWGDQDLLGEQCPQAATMPAAWFPRLSDIRWPDRSTEAKVILCKKPKNAVAVKTLRGFAEAWG